LPALSAIWSGHGAWKGKFKQPRNVLLFAIGPEFNLLLYSVSEVRGQIREMVDFPANGAD
jgi:hypothetical protein